MTLALQVAFVVATVLAWAGIAVLSVTLWRVRQGRVTRETPAGVVLRAGLLFAVVCLVVATPLHGFAWGGLSDIPLYAAVFGMAAATLTWFSDDATLRSRPLARRLVRGVSLVLPVGAGVLAGIVGTV